MLSLPVTALKTAVPLARRPIPATAVIPKSRFFEFMCSNVVSHSAQATFHVACLNITTVKGRSGDVAGRRHSDRWGEDLGAPRIGHLDYAVRAGFEPRRGGRSAPGLERPENDHILGDATRTHGSNPARCSQRSSICHRFLVSGLSAMSPSDLGGRHPTKSVEGPLRSVGRRSRRAQDGPSRLCYPRRI